MSVSIDLEGRRALVTGATRNIGLAIARLLARAGCDVAVLGGSDEDRVARVVAELRATGRRSVGATANLSDTASVEVAVEQATSELGPIDILVNNAAIRPHLDLSTASTRDWDAVMNVNLRAPFLLSSLLVPDMLSRDFGRVINISGLDAFWGGRGKPHVIASKAGLLGLTRALAVECEGSRVTANAVVPGAIDTDLRDGDPGAGLRKTQILARIPMARLGTVDEIANVCLFLSSDLASYVTGQSLVVSGGAFPALRPASRDAETS